jgi:Fic family protein
MIWNWQQADWPHFTYDSARLAEPDARLLLGAGLLFGAFKHLNENDKSQLTIELISNEALKTSEIEGDYLDRDSLQSSIRRQFGLAGLFLECSAGSAAPNTGPHRVPDRKNQAL